MLSTFYCVAKNKISKIFLLLAVTLAIRIQDILWMLNVSMFKTDVEKLAFKWNHLVSFTESLKMLSYLDINNFWSV